MLHLGEGKLRNVYPLLIACLSALLDLIQSQQSDYFLNSFFISRFMEVKLNNVSYLLQNSIERKCLSVNFSYFVLREMYLC